MTARLMVREVGQREFIAYNGDYQPSEEIASTETAPYVPPRTDTENATMEGERLCREGNVEAFQVWSLVTERRRVMVTEEVVS